MRTVRQAFALLACLPAIAAAAELPAWQIDPVHTRVVFSVEHAGFAQSLATLSGPEGVLRFDPDDWANASVDVRLPLSRLDFGDADWNRTMLGRRWFDAERHPEIRFTSTSVEPTGPDTARITGTLALAGTSHEAVLDVRMNAAKRNPMNFRRTVGFSATATLDRRDFGMPAYPNVIGQAVSVRIEVEAVRMDRAEAKADAEAEQPAAASEDDDAVPQHE